MRRGGEANRTFGRRCFLGIANFGRRCLLGRRPSSTLSFALVRCSVLLDLQAQGNQHGISECQLKQIRTQCHDRQIQQTGRSCRHTPNQNRGNGGNGNRFMITCSCTACSKARRHLHNSIQLPQLISNCRARDPNNSPHPLRSNPFVETILLRRKKRRLNPFEWILLSFAWVKYADCPCVSGYCSLLPG